MKRSIVLILAFVTAIMLTGCAKVSKSEFIVGQDIIANDITDFYYTESNINYDAYFLRYRIYKQGDDHVFFYERRERPGDYGPATEEDTVAKIEVVLTDDEWQKFYDLLSGGIVKPREDDATSGGSGPWTYLYWTGDETKYQVYSFESYGKEQSFVKLCESMIAE